MCQHKGTQIVLSTYRSGKYDSEIELAKSSQENGLKIEEITQEGKSIGFKGTYDPEQLAMGIKVEYEHTTSPVLSEKIAKDHLAEIPDYYSRLAKMEKEAGVED